MLESKSIQSFILCFNLLNQYIKYDIFAMTEARIVISMAPIQPSDLPISTNRQPYRLPFIIQDQELHSHEQIMRGSFDFDIDQNMIARNDHIIMFEQNQQEKHEAILRLNSDYIPREQIMRSPSDLYLDQKLDSSNKIPSHFEDDKYPSKSCQICSKQYLITRRFYNISTCNHRYCQNCVKQWVHLLLNNFMEFRCPSENCKTPCKEKDSSFYKRMTLEQVQQLQKINNFYQILKNPNAFSCKKVNCKGKINKNDIELKCQVCNSMHCLKCYQVQHKGQICFKKEVKNLRIEKKFRQCKKCRNVIEKSDGCTHITCICGNQLCYRCGQTVTGSYSNHLCPSRRKYAFLDRAETNIENRSQCLKRYFWCMQIRQDRPIVLKILWVIFYCMLFYPFQISLALILFFFAIIIEVIICFLFSILATFYPLCRPGGGFQKIFNCSEYFGRVLSTILIILLSPLIQLVVFVYLVLKIGNVNGFNNGRILESGIYNLIGNALIPCLIVSFPDENSEEDN